MSSNHVLGRDIKNKIDGARVKISNFLECSPSELIFTSCGTESDNTAIMGVYNNFARLNPGKIPHFVVSNYEHPAILAPTK